MSDSGPKPDEPERRGIHGFRAFRHRDFTLYWASRVLSTIGIEMMMITVGWQVYRLTGEALDLGLIGLAQFAPFALLFLVTGLVADRFSRVRILGICIAIQTVGAVLFFLMSATGNAAFGPILAILIVFGIARAFMTPVLSSIIPALVPTDDFGNAIAWGTLGQQISRIAGPTIGGILIAVGEARGQNEAPVYATVSVILFISVVMVFLIRTKAQVENRSPMSIETLIAGLRFIWTRQVIFAAVTMDLFAVLFGGAVALLPIYAKDILQVGSEGFGLLRSAFMVGAFISALILTQRPVTRNAGIKLLVSAGIFGAGVMVFGASTSFWLSVVALAVMGAADIVSVFVRHNLVQLITPDEMRGRVGAVVGVIVGASNELGEFESGVTAHWFGTVPAVVLGGGLTLGVASLYLWLYPAIRQVDSLDADTLVARFRVPHDRHGPLKELGPPS